MCGACIHIFVPLMLVWKKFVPVFHGKSLAGPTSSTAYHTLISVTVHVLVPLDSQKVQAFAITTCPLWDRKPPGSHWNVVCWEVPVLHSVQGGEVLQMRDTKKFDVSPCF